MSIIIRLQNLPWSANSVDIRRFFSGLSIPEGGVHIVGGEMGDAFIAFSTDEDARLAMAKDGGKIKDMQIKLLLSSRTEMMRVIEQARQQNMVVTQPHVVTPQPAILSLQQPARIMTPTNESDRRRARSPSPHRRSRDRSPTRDRRRSPDDRRGSKRDRSRSPRSSRSFNRDMDRRSDRFKRDDRRYDDSRYRDERRSTRDSSQEPKKYFDADHVNSRSQLHATEGFRNMQAVYEQTPNVAVSGLYPFGNQQASTVVKSFPEAYAHLNSSVQLSQTGGSVPNKSVDFTLMDQKLSSSAAYSQEQVLFRGSSFQPSIPSTKESSVPVEQQSEKPRRRTRFEPEFMPSSAVSHFAASGTKTVDNQRETSYGARPPLDSYSEARSSWPHEVKERSENAPWNEKRQGLLNHPVSKNGDFLQVVPMDLDPSPSDMTPEKEIYLENVPPRGPPPYARNNASPRNDELRRDSQNRGPPMHNDNKGPLIRNDRGSSANSDNRGLPSLNETQSRILPSLTVEVRGLPPDARIDHILDLFHGIPLPAANVRIEASDKGFEKAFIRFVSVTDFEEALSRNRHFMHEGRCELVPCPLAAFDSAHSQKSKPKPKPREEDLTVQIRGLPFSCKEDDVVRFFDGLGILDLYVGIAPDGRATGTGFVEFGTPEDFRAALAMNGKMIGHRYITVSVASKEMMAFARGEEDYNNPVIQPKDPHSNSQYLSSSHPPYSSTIQSRVLPNQIKSPSINHGRPPMNQEKQLPSNNPVRPNNNLLPPNNQGRPLPPNNQGRPLPPSNQGRPLPPNNQGRQPPPNNQERPPPNNQERPPPPNNQGRPPPPNNQGRPLPSNNQGRPLPSNNQGRPLPSNNQGRPPPSNNQGRPLPPNNDGRPPPPCIAMKSLPEGVSNRNIADFLGQIGIMPQAVHIMLRPDKTPSGDAFAEFACPEDMERSLELNGNLMMGKRVLIQPISFHEMSEILGRPGPVLPPPPAPTALLRTPCDVQRPRRPLLPQGPGEPPFRERPRMEPPNRGNRPFMGPFKGHMESGRPPYGSGRMRGPWPKARTFNSGNRPEGRFPPPPGELAVKDFGSPGCVISIHNLHFRAGLEELLDFFQDYKITRDNIIRKYNENRQTTGEARVAFQTPRDAQRAVRELNQKPIMGRPLSLSIL